MVNNRSRRRQEYHSEPEKGNLYLFTGVVIGILLGLVTSWVILPVKYIDTVPSSLRSDYKNELRLLIAGSFHDNHNLPRAEARLALLGDPDIIYALTSQAQTLVTVGDPTDSAFLLANLVDAIRLSATEEAASTTPVPGSGFNNGMTPTPTDGSQISIDPLITPDITPSDTFFLKSTEIVCDSPRSSLLLMIDVSNSNGEPIPGIEIIITWPTGEEQFFTGFQPEFGSGYADFLMMPNTVYGIRVGSGDFSITNLSAPNCSNDNQQPRWGGLKITLQEP